MDKNQISRNNFLALIFAGCGLLLLMVLIPYSPADPAWNRTASGAVVSHWLGKFGAYFADILLSFIGYAAYLLPVGLIMMALRAWHSPNFGKDRASKGLIMLFVASLLLSMMFALHINSPINQTAITGGGAFGQFFSGILIEVCSVRLLMTICTVLFLFCLRFILGFRWSNIADLLGTWTMLGAGKNPYQQNDEKIAPPIFNQEETIIKQPKTPNLGNGFSDLEQGEVNKNKKSSANTAFTRLTANPRDSRANNLAKTSSFDENQNLVGEVSEAMEDGKKGFLGEKFSSLKNRFNAKVGEVLEEEKTMSEPVIAMLVTEEDNKEEQTIVQFENEVSVFAQEQKEESQQNFNDDFVFQNSIPTPPVTPMSVSDEENPFSQIGKNDLFSSNNDLDTVFANSGLSQNNSLSENPFNSSDLELSAHLEPKVDLPFLTNSENVEEKLSPNLDSSILAEGFGNNAEFELENEDKKEEKEEVKEEKEEKDEPKSGFKINLNRFSTNRFNPSFIAEQKKTSKAEKKFLLPSVSILDNSPIVEFLKYEVYKNAQSPLTIIMGKHNEKIVVANLIKMQNLLITGEGRNMALYSLLLSLFFKANLPDLRLLLADGGNLSLNRFGEIPQLLTPVINDYDDLNTALNWISNEVERRINLLEAKGIKKLSEYNEEKSEKEKLPYIVAVIGEISGVLPENSLNLLIKKCHRAGIHLIIVAENISEELKNNILSLWDIKADFSSSFKFLNSNTSINCPVIPVQNLSQLASYLRTQGIPRYEEGINSPLYL